MLDSDTGLYNIVDIWYTILVSLLQNGLKDGLQIGNKENYQSVMDRDGWSGKSLIINTLLPFTHLRLITYKSITTIKYK